MVKVGNVGEGEGGKKMTGYIFLGYFGGKLGNFGRKLGLGFAGFGDGECEF